MWLCVFALTEFKRSEKKVLLLPGNVLYPEAIFRGDSHLGLNYYFFNCEGKRQSSMFEAYTKLKKVPQNLSAVVQAVEDL